MSSESSSTLVNFEVLYRRLQMLGRGCVETIWRELLKGAPAPEDSELDYWLGFWRGRQSLMSPHFRVSESFKPELVFLALAENYAESHPITAAATAWLERNSPDQPWLRLLHRSKQPAQRPLTIPLESKEFDDYCKFPDFLAVSEDGARALLRSYDKNVVFLLDLHQGSTRRVGVLPQARLVAVPGERLLLLRPQSVELRNWQLDELRHWPLSGVEQAAVAGSLERVVLCRRSDDGHELVLWDALENRLGEPWPLQRAVESLSLSPDGRWLGMLVGSQAQLWQLGPGGERVELYDSAHHTARGVSAASRLAECVGPCEGRRRGPTYLLDLVNQQEWDLDQPPSKPAASLLIPGQAIITRQEGDFRQACPVRVWDTSADVAELRQRFRLPLPSAKLALSQDQETLLATCGDFQARVFSLSYPWNEPAMHQHHSAILSMSLACADSLLVTCSTDQTVRVFDLENEGECTGVFSGHGAWPYATITEDGRFLLVSSETGGWLYDLREKRRSTGDHRLSRWGHAVTVREGHLVVWDPVDGRELHCFGEHRAEISDFSCSPFEARACSADQSGVIHVWDMLSGESLYCLDFGQPILSVGWASSKTIHFFPKTHSNFHYGWTITREQADSGFPSIEFPPHLASKTGRSASGEWQFEFGIERYHPSQLLVSDRHKKVTMCWPQSGIALFRGNNQLILGCSTGEVCLFEIRDNRSRTVPSH